MCFWTQSYRRRRAAAEDGHCGAWANYFLINHLLNFTHPSLDGARRARRRASAALRAVPHGARSSTFGDRYGGITTSRFVLRVSARSRSLALTETRVPTGKLILAHVSARVLAYCVGAVGRRVGRPSLRRAPHGQRAGSRVCQRAGACGWCTVGAVERLWEVPCSPHNATT
jgi:hypothetical protein